MSVLLFLSVVMALLLFAGIGYLVVLRFRRVRLKADLLRLFTFEVDAERDEVPP